jgi:hypothetical protein
MIKQCRKCKRVLSDKDFHKDAKSPDGLRGICKRCATASATASKRRVNAKCHGLLDVYHDILRRCCDPSDKSYSRYGGRGITVCDEWRNDRNSFVRWCMANGYAPGLQIDRIDNDKGYSPDNCRFVTPAENQHNTSQTALSEKAVNIIRGNNVSRRKTQKQLAKELGVSQSRISDVCRNRTWKRGK